MDDFQDRLVRVGLGEYGFALAGGYALQAHRLVDRLSEDVDMFTNDQEPERFTEAVAALADACRQQQLKVDIVRQADTFARLEVVAVQGARSGALRRSGRCARLGSAQERVSPIDVCAAIAMPGG